MSRILANPPENNEHRELWMQHAAGYIIFQNIRNYAIGKIPKQADSDIEQLCKEVIDHAIYGMMMQIDGVFDDLENQEYRLALQNHIVLYQNNKVLIDLNLLHSDGMCMGFHDWKEQDFGEHQITNEIE